MKIAGIIAEYNPFHNGHKYQIEETKKQGATHIVAVMSGNCVQRGELAVCDKHIRARNAVLGGADLVIELPVPYSLGTAPDFAKAGVEILKRLGCVDYLSFGSECGDIESLLSAMAEIEMLDADDIKRKMAEGLTYPTAVASLVSENAKAILDGANNTLAIEYLKSIEGSGILPVTVKRTAGHDSNNPNSQYASASFIREALRKGDNADEFIPVSCGVAPISNMKNIEGALLYRLSMMARDDFADVPYADGLESRLFEASRIASSLDELYDAVKTKNITQARVRRAIMLAALGVRKEDMVTPLPYVRVLAANEKGIEILGKAKKSADIAISASLAELSRIDESAYRFAQLDELSSRLLHLSLNEKGRYISEFSRKFEIIK